MEGSARVLGWPVFIAATVLFLAAGVLSWKPLPLALEGGSRIALTLLGVAIYFPALALYGWGLRTLGSMFGVASGFGVRLYEGHHLVKSGPYAYVRHPMYLAVVLAGLGGLLLYRTWATLLFFLTMFGLVLRAGREERALAAEFGAAWGEYAAQVPAFVPRLKRRSGPRAAAGQGPGEEVSE
jgi:protein-S-isoprenylcysteine O-methyltransferase Ste14